MPRTSAASLAIVSISAAKQRVQPRPDAPAEVRSLIRELAATVEPEHFRKSDLPLLESYARAILLERQAYVEIAASGAVVNGRPSAWLTVAEKAGRQIVAVSARLRLAPQSRTDPKTAGKKAPPASPYDEMD